MDVVGNRQRATVRSSQHVERHTREDPSCRRSRTISTTIPTERRAAQVVVPGVPMVLSYSVAANQSALDVGSEVVVDVGNRRTVGWVIEVMSVAEAASVFRAAAAASRKTDSQLGLFAESEASVKFKPILEVRPAFLPDQIRLFLWMSEYYGAPISEVLETALPQRTEQKSVLWATVTDPESAGNELAVLKMKAPLQAAVLSELLEKRLGVAVSTLEVHGRAPHAALKALSGKGLVTLEDRTVDALDEIRSGNSSAEHSLKTAPELTVAQARAIEHIHVALDRSTFDPLLLYGVTGSGKTEVYIHALQKVLAGTGSALLIVPEIALTPQLLDQLQSRFSVPLAVLHSQVGSRARWSSWEALLSGEIRLAIGARSAIFAPMKNLQLIIVDEEHESSYKQSDGLRYHGRDLAVMRAKFANCPVLLGSATPSFESLLNAQSKRYTLLELPERVTKRELPKIEIIDLTKLKRKEMVTENISPQLFQALTETLTAKEQAVILYNRRGFSSYLQCDTCGESVSCPNCSVALTFHKQREKLICHYCGLTIPPPTHCPSCRDPQTSRIEECEHVSKATERVGQLRYQGSGTERVVEELAALFPQANIARMDRDTVGKKDAYREILGSMRSGTADILVGTQMIAKGHDLPGVTLVGIINADVGLHLPDFRSGEKTFQLITQAAGRAGRGLLPGRVFVQTREANHPTIVAVVTGRFKAFARYQLDQRKALAYPPFGRLLRLVVSSQDPAEALAAAQAAARITQAMAAAIATETGDTSQTLQLLGPAPAPHEKLRGRYRFHLLVKSPSAKVISRLAAALHTWKGQQKQFEDFRLAIDVDPFEML